MASLRNMRGLARGREYQVGSFMGPVFWWVLAFSILGIHCSDTYVALSV